MICTVSSYLQCPVEVFLIYPTRLSLQQWRIVTNLLIFI